MKNNSLFSRYIGWKAGVGKMNSNSIDTRQVRIFGVVATLLFGGFCAIAVWKGKIGWLIVWGIFFLFGLACLLLPKTMLPVYERWVKVARWIGTGVTLFLLTVIFYLVITPTGLIKRIAGGRPLPMKPDPEARSYWVDRTEPIQGKERYSKRF